MNFAPFTGHIPTAAAMPTIHQFAAKFGYEGGGAQETRYQSGGVQFAVAPAAGAVAVDGVKFRQAESVVVVSSAPAGSVTLAGIAPIHTVNTGVKYQTISSSVNLGSVAYAPAYAELKDGKREFRDDITHDIMATMMQQQVSQAPLQQGTQQLLVVLHEPKEAAALARAIKQEGRVDRTPAAPAEFISIGDVSDATWQSLGGGVADYLSALPLPLHHLLKYSDKREEPATAAPVMTSTPVNTVVVQTTAVAPPPPAPPKKKKKKKATKEKKPRPKPGEIRLTTALVLHVAVFMCITRFNFRGTT
ncbi:hypothetical protein MSG28_003960 [Choristoneura fumiferana]|uniref:Uncharacterized protein n=1 Tax=Choristoneura fumiferana TaxID=7141 RepID=A0ACC0KHI7_CHOFU|nr:hypothetical protein MSG28_003960 [Choristoneura fumiferana]